MKTDKIPQHIVLFPDGNRRWAKREGISIASGYKEGQKNFKRFLNYCAKKGVKIITVFGFSTENWDRPKQEINYLMKFFEEYLNDGLKEFQKNKIRVKIIGQKEKLPTSLQKVINKIENSTKDNKDFHLNLAVSYGGRWDIVQAVQKIIEEKIYSKEITEELINQYLSTAGLPEPDLIIRAGGEKRFSNFVLWQGAYSELFFSDKLWPDFNEKDLDKALNEYSSRQRRFGK